MGTTRCETCMQPRWLCSRERYTIASEKERRYAPKCLQPVPAHSLAHAPLRAFSGWRGLLFNDGSRDTALPLFIIVLTAQKKNTSRPRVTALSFQQIILKKCRGMKNSQSGQAGVVPQYCHDFFYDNLQL